MLERWLRHQLAKETVRRGDDSAFLQEIDDEIDEYLWLTCEAASSDGIVRVGGDEKRLDQIRSRVFEKRRAAQSMIKPAARLP